MRDAQVVFRPVGVERRTVRQADRRCREIPAHREQRRCDVAGRGIAPRRSNALRLHRPIDGYGRGDRQGGAEGEAGHGVII